ncbi:MAG: MotA/TolQ/ExbB proton channel family protein [Bryobacterales bacterium]
MDLATIVGLVVALALVMVAILMGGSPMMFVDPSSVMIVVGGTVGATLIRNPLKQVLGTFRVVGKGFTTKIPQPDDLIRQVVELSQKARKEGILGLENAEIEYAFLAKAVGLCVDGRKEEEIRSIVLNEMRSTAARHKRGQEILRGMGSAAPAFGMVGTLIGLVQMLASMSDPSQIGPAMALALLTTLYGALISNVFCLPLADKLQVRSQEELLSMQVCLDGVLGIADGLNPKSLDEQLKSFIAPKSRQQPGEQEKAA